MSGKLKINQSRRNFAATSEPESKQARSKAPNQHSHVSVRSRPTGSALHSGYGFWRSTISRGSRPEARVSFQWR
jgi:hypothetical protein